MKKKYGYVIEKEDLFDRWWCPYRLIFKTREEAKTFLKEEAHPYPEKFYIAKYEIQ